VTEYLSVRQVCERALQKIGAFTTHDTGADQDELERSAEWLDMVIGNLTAQQRALWLVDNAVTKALTVGTASYDLLTFLDADAPETGVQFVVSAKIVLSSGQEAPCDIIRRDAYEAIDNKEQTGIPCQIYVDRLHPRPTFKTWPVLGTGQTASLRLKFARYANDADKKPIDKQKIDIPRAWNLWAVWALAAEIGDGPVRKLPDGEVRRIHTTATGLLDGLFAFENQEHANEPRRTAYTDF
jgi:hypothetical protein